MPCRVCERCDLAVPLGHDVCPVCEGSTRYVANRMPHPDWQLRARDMIAAASAPAAPIPVVKIGTVLDEHSRRWLYAADIRSAGYLGAIESFALLDTLDGIVEVQGYDAKHKRYWIEVLS